MPETPVRRTSTPPPLPVRLLTSYQEQGTALISCSAAWPYLARSSGAVAGVTAALNIHSARPDRNVLLVTKSVLDDGSTRWALLSASSTFMIITV